MTFFFFFFFVHHHQTEWRQKRQQHRSVLTRHFWHGVCGGELAGTMPQCAHTTLPAPELDLGARAMLNWGGGEQGRIYCTFRLQHPKWRMLPIDWNWGQNLVLWEWRSLPQGYPGQRGCLASGRERGGRRGASAGADSCCHARRAL